MVPSGGLGGRARLRAARWRSLGLMAVLLLPIAVEALDRLATLTSYEFADRAVRRSSFGAFLFDIEVVVSWAGPLIAGMLIDRYGLKRILAVAMIVWCGMVAAGSVFASPAGYPLGAPLVTFLLPGFVLTGVLVAVARFWPARRRSVTVAILFLAYGDARAWPYTGASYLTAAVHGWSEAASVIATAGAVLVILWLVVFREPQEPIGRPGDREPAKSWGLRGVLLITWLNLWFSIASRSPLYTSWSFGAARQGTVPMIQLWEPVVWAAAFLASAYWSERLRGRFGSRAASRSVFIAIGYAVLAASALASTNESVAAALPLVVTAGIGTASLADLLVVDAAPSVGTGTYIGLVLTAELVALYYAKPLILDALGAIGVRETPLLVIASLIGAVSSYGLLRLPSKAAQGPVPQRPV